MSEFQYYEFYSIDRELTKQEREEIAGLSSRFSPTSRRAIFSYSYSSFRHDVESVLLKYFDFFLYISNWGTKRLMYKFPIDIVDYKEIKQYICDFDNYVVNNGIRIFKKSGFVLVDINLSEEGGDIWIEEEDRWSSDLIGLRQDIIEGDYRSLFIIWLHIKQLEYESKQIEIETEIPRKLIPNNLDRLNARLESLMRLYQVNIDWFKGASKYSESSNSQEHDYSEEVQKLPIDRKNEYLLKILRGEYNLRIKLKKEIDQLQENREEKPQMTSNITLKELLGSIENEENKRKVLEQKQVERQRLNKLKETEKNKNIILGEIDYHIKRGTGKSYDEALIRILALRDLSIHQEKQDQFTRWIKVYKENLSNKPAMLKRLTGKGI